MNATANIGMSPSFSPKGASCQRANISVKETGLVEFSSIYFKAVPHKGAKRLGSSTSVEPGGVNRHPSSHSLA